MIDLKNHFKQKDVRHADAKRQHKWFIKARDDREKREQITDKAEDDLVAAGAEVMMATELQLRAFEEKLDRYDTHTTAALMNNREQLDAVAARLESLLSQAHVMDDGRRVFKSEDGTQVFDEFGQSVSAEELDPELISNARPTWEAFSEEVTTRERLLGEQSELHAFQTRLDDTREQIEDGELSQENLEALDAELLDAMPSAVRVYTPEAIQQVSNDRPLPVPGASDGTRMAMGSPMTP